MPKIKNSVFLNRPADIVARELLGCALCVQRTGARRADKFMITETEAYLGPHDMACHASKGKTKRTEIMYRDAGTLYVYLIYGIYAMLNIVTGNAGYPAATLIRGAGVYDGPGKLTKALNISLDYNGRMLGKKTGIWIESRPKDIYNPRILATPRIGVEYAGPWAKKKLRYVLKPYQS